jgi:hypothetical protein
MTDEISEKIKKIEFDTERKYEIIVERQSKEIDIESKKNTKVVK